MSTAKFHIIIPPQNIEGNPDCLKKIAAGEVKAFEWLYKNYSGKLYDYVYLLCSDPHLSEDVVQDVFAGIWKNREGLDKVKNANAYLHAAARNRLLNVRKSRKTELANLAQYRYRVPQYTNACVIPENETKALIYEAFSLLTKRQRLFYRLTREEEKSHLEISEEYGVAINTVKNIIVSANKKLREFVEGM